MLSNMTTDKPIVFFDIETTGLDVAKDRIVQFAAIKTDLRFEEKKLNRRFNPGIPIDPEATKVHGITNEMVKDWPRLEQYAVEIYEFMLDCYVSGFNIRHFDLPILLRELDRCGCSLSEKLKNEDILDLMEIYHQREPRDLSAAFRFYCGDREELGELSQTLPNAHDAEADATAAMCIFNGQMRRYEGLPGSLGEVCKVFTKPGSVDIAGKLERNDGRIFLTFGKHVGRSLQDVEEGYLSWMLDKNVIGPDAVHLIKEELASRRRTFK